MTTCKELRNLVVKSKASTPSYPMNLCLYFSRAHSGVTFPPKDTSRKFVKAIRQFVVLSPSREFFMSRQILLIAKSPAGFCFSCTCSRQHTYQIKLFFFEREIFSFVVEYFYSSLFHQIRGEIIVCGLESFRLCVDEKLGCVILVGAYLRKLETSREQALKVHSCMPIHLTS